MKIALFVLLCLAALWTLVSGALALTTGRVAAFRAGHVLRPRLWGAGQLCFGAGVTLASLTTRSTVAAGDVPGWAVPLCLLAYALLTWRSSRP
ncbi:hypothetical protein [Streptomyces sp. NPDC001070]